MIIRSLVLALAGICAVTSSIAQAGIVLTPVQTSLPSSTNVTVNLYARWDGNLTGGGIPNPNVNSNRVGAYQFRVNITGGSVTGLAAQHTANPGSAWSGVAPFAVFPSGSPSISGQQIEWRAANTSAVNPIPIPNATIGSVNNLSTLLGTIQFNAPIGNYTFNFTPVLSADYTNVSGFAYINSNGPADQFQHTFASPPVVISVVAVPEPSTLALCALGGVIYPVRRLIRKRKQAQPAA